jgi:putative peptidoglycan lipid II flippase
MGLVREQAFAILFGASREYDSFLTAFRIPNMLRDLLAEGALSASFVTTLTRELSLKGEKRGWQLANRVLTAQVLILLGISMLGILASPWIVDLLAPGFRLIPGKAELTTLMTRIMFPFLILVGAAAVAMGMLNAKERFGVPHSASTFFNIGSIAGGILFGYLLDPKFGSRAIIGMALGTLFGGILQFLCQVPSLHRIGFRFSPELTFRDSGVAKVLFLMTPSVIGSAAVQVNILVNNNFASYLGNGAVSWLNYAFRLVHLPIGIFGVAIMSATTPALSRALSTNDLLTFRKTLNSSLNLCLSFCIPASLGLIVLSDAIVQLIYQYGRFTQLDTHQTGVALACYAIGLAAYAASRLIHPAFLALGDARSPMVVSLGSIFSNFVLNWFFILHWGMGHWGLALSSSFVSIVNFAALLHLMRKRVRGIGGKRILRSAVRILGASVVMAILAWTGATLIRSWIGDESVAARLATVFGSVFLGLGGYALACRALGVRELEVFLGEIARFRVRP